MFFLENLEIINSEKIFSNHFTVTCKYYGLLEKSQNLKWYLNEKSIDDSKVKFHISQIEMNHENTTVSVIELTFNSVANLSCSYKNLLKTLQLNPSTGKSLLL